MLWWAREDRDDAARLLEEATLAAYENDAPRRTEAQKNLVRYGQWLTGLFPDMTAAASMRSADELRINLVRAVTETITAKVGSNRPRPRILTTDGDWLMKQKCKKMQRFVDAMYSASNLYDQAPVVFRDCMLVGTGVIGFDISVGRQQICAERIFPLEVLTPAVDSVDGDPKELFRVRYLDRDNLIDLYPGHADEIESGKSYGPDLDTADLMAFTYAATKPRVVRVTYGWRKASYTAAGECIPGRFILACNGVALEDEEWPHDYFPFEFLHYSKPVRGMWGSSAVSEVRPLENECNRLIQQAAAAMHIAGNPIVLVPTKCKVKTQKWTNEPGIFIEYDSEGGKPEVVTTQNPASPQIIQQAWTLYAKAFEIVGTNQLAASATKPAGIESGVALEQLGEEHSVRFKHISQHYESVLAVGCARQFIRCAQQLDQKLKDLGKPGYVIKSKAGKQTIKLDWDKASISPDDLLIDCFPVGLLPHLPAGRMQAVERYKAMGLIDATMAAELLEFPDLDSVSSPIRADFNLLEKQLAEMLEDGKEHLPDPRQNLQRCLAYGTFCYLEAKMDGAPIDRLDLVDRYLTACEDLIAASTPAPAPDPSAPPAAPVDPMAAMPAGLPM